MKLSTADTQMLLHTHLQYTNVQIQKDVLYIHTHKYQLSLRKLHVMSATAAKISSFMII